MEIRSLREIKGVLEKFPEAGSCGNVVFPEMARIAKGVGLPGYAEALHAYNTMPIQTVVYKNIEEIPDSADVPSTGVVLSWNGPSIWFDSIHNRWFIGLKRTLEDIEFFNKNEGGDTDEDEE